MRFSFNNTFCHMRHFWVKSSLVKCSVSPNSGTLCKSPTNSAYSTAICTRNVRRTSTPQLKLHTKVAFKVISYRKVEKITVDYNVIKNSGPIFPIRTDQCRQITLCILQFFLHFVNAGYKYCPEKKTPKQF